MPQTNESRRAFLARSAGLAAASLAVPGLVSCTATSSDGKGGEGLLESLKKQGFVKIGVRGEVPLGYIDKKGRVTGAAPEVVRAVFKTLGVPEVKATQVGLEQLIPALNARQFDVVCAGLYVIPERCKNAQFSTPDYSVQDAFIVPKGNPKNITTLADVVDSDIKLATSPGSAEAGYAKSAGVKQARMTTFESPQANLQAVASGRAYAFMTTDIGARLLVEQNPNAGVEATPSFWPVVDGKKVVNAGGFVFRKGEPELVEAFNRELTRIHDNGDWLKIVKPFGLTKDNLPPSGVTTERLCAAK